MKIMNVSLSIDVANITHVEALEVFMRTLGGHPFQTELKLVSMEEEEAPEEEKESKEEKAKRERRERAEARKKKAEAELTKAKAEAEEEEEEEEEDYGIEDDEEEEEIPELSPALLRKLTGEKVEANEAKNKPKVAKMLVKFGVKNVATIPEEHWEEYYEFITSL